MLEHQHCSNEEMGVSNAKGTEQKANGSLAEHVPTAETGLNCCKATSYAAAPPQENGVAGHEPKTVRIQVPQSETEDLRRAEDVEKSENGPKSSPGDVQRFAGSSPDLQNGEARREVAPGAELKNQGNGHGDGANGAVAPATSDQGPSKEAEQRPDEGRGGSKQASIESNKELKSREGEKGGGDKGERSKSRSGKDSRKDSKGDRSRTKASKDKDKDKKRSRRSTRSRSRSRRRGSKHRSPSKLSPPRKRRARGSRSSTRSSSPSPRPRFSRGISPGAMPPRARPFGGMQRSPPFSRGVPPPAGPWGYGGGPPYEPHGYGPPRGGYSPPRRWPGPGRSPPPYGYERPYGYGGPPPNGSRSPPPGQIYGRNPTTGSPLYGPPPPSHGGPWERALPVEPRPAAQGKVWGARSGWDSVAPDIPARDLPPVRRASYCSG